MNQCHRLSTRLRSLAGQSRPHPLHGPEMLEWGQVFSAADRADVVDDAVRKGAAEFMESGKLVPVQHHLLVGRNEFEGAECEAVTPAT